MCKKYWKVVSLIVFCLKVVLIGLVYWLFVVFTQPPPKRTGGFLSSSRNRLQNVKDVSEPRKVKPTNGYFVLPETSPLPAYGWFAKIAAKVEKKATGNKSWVR